MGRGQRWNRAKLLALREALGLTPEDFASKIGGGVRGRTVRRWESGESEPQLENLGLIADAFNVDIDTFFLPRNPGMPEAPKPRRGRPPKDVAKKSS